MVLKYHQEVVGKRTKYLCLLVMAEPDHILSEIYEEYSVRVKGKVDSVICTDIDLILLQRVSLGVREIRELRY